MTVALIDFQALINRLDALPYRFTMDGQVYNLYHALKLINSFSDFDCRVGAARVLYDLGYRQIVNDKNGNLKVLLDLRGKGLYANMVFFDPIPASSKS